jgi:hypothetical protein
MNRDWQIGPTHLMFPITYFMPFSAPVSRGGTLVEDQDAHE